MHDVNWWLMTLAFLIGLVLTLALMIRRVTREVPVTHVVSAAVTAAGAAAGAAAKVRGAAEKVHGDVHAAAEKVHGDVHAAAEKVHGDVHTLAQRVDTVESRGIIEAAPFGSGSIRVTRRSTAPAGYRIKGLTDTKRYYTAGSPDFETIETEYWFTDEESAENAGFARWDAAPGATYGLVDTAAKFASAGQVPAGPYGKGSAKADADGSGPAGWAIKGNADSMLYHTTESQWYGQTIAEVWFADEESATRAGFLRWDTKKGEGGGAPVASIAEVPPGPYGKGSAKAGPEGSGPAGWLIKGNADSMLYHPPTSPAYKQTIAEVWFFDEATAKKAGFDKWDKNFT